MSILISGGTGFIGTALAEALLGRGERVVLHAIDRPAAPIEAWLRALPGELRLEQGDVRDEAGFEAVLRRHGVTRLFPFAAVTSGPERESADPASVLDVNLMGFLAQMRAARAAGVRRVIAPSSGAVYGEGAYQAAPLDEANTPCRPITLYGVSKYALERAALRLGELWGLEVIAARIGATFGPWERETGLRDTLSLPWRLLRAARAGESVALPAALPPYPWVYGRDTTSALIALLDLPGERLPPPAERVFNLSHGQDWGPVMADWARLLEGAYPGFACRRAGPGEAHLPLNDARPRALVSGERLRAIGWAPAFTPETAFADYLAWVRRAAAAGIA